MQTVMQMERWCWSRCSQPSLVQQPMLLMEWLSLRAGQRVQRTVRLSPAVTAGRASMSRCCKQLQRGMLGIPSWTGLRVR